MYSLIHDCYISYSSIVLPKRLFVWFKNQIQHLLSFLEVCLIFILVYILSKTWSFTFPLLLGMTQKQLGIFVSNLASFLLWCWRVPEHAIPNYVTLAYGLYLTKHHWEPADRKVLKWGHKFCFCEGNSQL